MQMVYNELSALPLGKELMAKTNKYVKKTYSSKKYLF